MNNKLTNRLYSSSGLLILLVLFLAVVAVSNHVLRGVRFDFTANKLYTLSDGTRSVLTHIDEPINLYFFYSRNVGRDIPSINTHARRVEDMLHEFAGIAGDKIKLNIIDPLPFSDEEDRAVELGIEPVPVDDVGTSLYFGLAGTNAIDGKEAIGFFQRDRAGLLEYDLAKLVYQLAVPEKPKVGILSTVDMGGGFNAQTYQPTPEWVIKQRLGELFEVKSLEQNIRVIPTDIKVLLVVQPATLSDSSLYAIDQFVLSGGRVMMFVDPHSSAARPQQQESQPTETASLDKLLTAWGVEYKSDEVLTDAKFALAVAGQRGQPAVYHLGMLSVQADSLSQDDVVTRGLKSINVGYAGVLQPVKDAKTQFTPLISSSDQSQMMPVSRVQNLYDPQELQRGFTPSKQQYVLAARISGKLHSAFTEAPAFPDNAEDDAANPGTHLAESVDDANVIVVADTDMLTDRFWVQIQQFFGQQMAMPWASNGDFVVNAVDNLLGSSALIGIRSRADYVRPFERVDALRREADARFRAKEEELKNSLRLTEQKLTELQANKQDGNALMISPEQEQEILRFQEEKLSIRKQLRDVRHQLDKDIDALGSVLKFINIALVPIILSVLVLLVGWLKRRRRVQLKGASA